MPRVGERVRIDIEGWGAAEIVGKAPEHVMSHPTWYASLLARGWPPHWLVLPEESKWADWTPGETLWVREADLTPLED